MTAASTPPTSQSDTGRVTQFTTRAATLADAPAIHDLVSAAALDHDGRTEEGLDGVVADLTRPAIDLTRDTRVAHDPAGELAGWGWVHLGRRFRVDVHPRYRGTGLGTELLGWVHTRARELGSQRIGQNVSDGDRAAAELLRRHGYVAKATNWLLEIDVIAEPVLPELPPGLTVRPFVPGDETVVHQVIQDAFDEWQQRRHPYDEWARGTVERDTFAPALSPLAIRAGEVVGAVVSLLVPGQSGGYIEELAVRADSRHQGIARILLRHAFRGFHDAGRRTAALWTHSDTGALSLYERVGMTVRRSSTHYSVDLTAG